MAHGAEAALLQYGATMTQPGMPHYEQLQHPQHAHLGHQHAHNMQYAMPQAYGAHESPYLPQQDMAYAGHVRMGSVPVNSGLDLHDDKRRKGSAVTATNDKELREMLHKNEGRPLREVAVEVIQKERTPMAEKTKQLFAMLW